MYERVKTAPHRLNQSGVIVNVPVDEFRLREDLAQGGPDSLI